MADSHLRRLAQSHDRSEPDLETEAAFRAKRDAERAAQERADALERVRAHRKEAAQTRALRPANVTPPEEASAAPASPAPPAPHVDASSLSEPSVETSEVRATSGLTTRPGRDTRPIKPGRQVPPPVPTRPSSTSTGRVQQLLEALGEAERRLLANDVPGALDVLGRAKRG